MFCTEVWPFFVSCSSFPSLIHSSVFFSLGKRRCFLSPSLSLFFVYPGSPDSRFYSHKSYVFFGKVSDTLLCLGNKLEGRPGIGGRGEAAQNVDEGREGVGEEWDGRAPGGVKDGHYHRGWACCWSNHLKRGLKSIEEMDRGPVLLLQPSRKDEMEEGQKDASVGQTDQRRKRTERGVKERKLGQHLSLSRQMGLLEALIICTAMPGGKKGQRSASWPMGASVIHQSELKTQK